MQIWICLCGDFSFLCAFYILNNNKKIILRDFQEIEILNFSPFLE